MELDQAKKYLEIAQQKLEVYLNEFDKLLSKKNTATNLLAIVEDKLQIRKSYIVLALVAFVLAIVLANGTALLCDVIIYVYPTYQSIKAIESTDRDDDSKWLTYWICYCAVSLIESVAWPLIVLVVSDYYLFKTAFFVWCMYPSSKWNGSIIIYEHVIRPLFLKYETKLDSAVSEVTKTLNDTAVSEVTKTLNNAAVSEAKKALNEVQLS